MKRVKWSEHTKPCPKCFQFSWVRRKGNIYNVLEVFTYECTKCKYEWVDTQHPDLMIRHYKNELK